MHLAGFLIASDYLHENNEIKTFLNNAMLRYGFDILKQATFFKNVNLRGFTSSFTTQ